ncbi:phosphoenolpyruvate carboxykinase-domain-containing protein [Multifurca ochricompacta]|uniref:Phosphoenolpyruvate carboxykinase-domain-containing protein n=1 Tax=Multifurca ochricompacta TaxID=376703 RepID=A0AAD4LWL7_9AGAM|nr:phosphoenolpyruvate carboxykinase-domain-containing protein [Multifurca ochricompacta]
MVFLSPFRPSRRAMLRHSLFFRNAGGTHGEAPGRLLVDHTGWTGGRYGTGKRCPLAVTRRIVDAVHSGELRTANYETFDTFNLQIPTAIEGVPANCSILRLPGRIALRLGASS